MQFKHDITKESIFFSFLFPPQFRKKFWAAIREWNMKN